MKRILTAAAFILALAGSAAQAAFEDQGAGARAPGLGNAFTALADDVYAIYYNPSGLAQLDRPQFSTAYTRLLMGLSDGTNLSLSQLAYAYPIKNGRQGTLGFGYQQYSASTLYSERTIHLSYGRLLWQSDAGSHLLGGVSLKQLSHSFGSSPEASNACNDGVCASGADPVLSGANTKSAYDADIGFIYRFPKRLQIGLAVLHVNQPDVGFGGPDKVPMSTRVGVAWKSLWMSLMGEVRQEQSPVGTTDRDLILAAERFFPTLTSGQFGLRGSFGYGSRDFEQITMGLSYRINKIQIDYGFMMPLAGVEGTMGTHRVSLGWHFGAPTPDEEITQELLDQARALREGHGPSYGYEYAEELKPQDLDDLRLAEVRRLVETRLYQQAHEALAKFVKGQGMSTPPLLRLSNRLELVSHYYPDWSGLTNPWEHVAVSGIDNFLRGHDRRAMLKASYALNLSRNDTKFDHLVAEMETALSLKAERLAADHPRSFIDEMLYRVEAANSRNEMQTVDALLSDILDLDPSNYIATERVGSMYYILGRYQDSIDTWEKALTQEKRSTEIENIRRYIELARERLGGPKPAQQVQPVVAAPAPARPPVLAPAAAPKPALQRPQAAPRGDVRDVERLFQKGVEHYARGEYLQATAMFMRILQIDPENAQARKALERIQNKAPESANP